MTFTQVSQTILNFAVYTSDDTKVGTYPLSLICQVTASPAGTLYTRLFNLIITSIPVPPTPTPSPPPAIIGSTCDSDTVIIPKLNNKQYILKSGNVSYNF